MQSYTPKKQKSNNSIRIGIGRVKAIDRGHPWLE